MDSAMATMIVNKSFNQIVKNTSQLQSLKLTINNEKKNSSPDVQPQMHSSPLSKYQHPSRLFLQLTSFV